MTTKDFRILADNRLLFVCPSCGSRKIYPILNIQRTAIRCQNCGISTRCAFTRRPMTLVTTEEKKIEVVLCDLSASGVGFEIQDGREARGIRIGQKIRLICEWNPGLLPEAQFIVKSVKGYKIGVEKAK